jgi:hypothetical protein
MEIEEQYLYEEYKIGRTITFKEIAAGRTIPFQSICNWKNNSFLKNMQLEKKPVSDNAI